MKKGTKFELTDEGRLLMSQMIGLGYKIGLDADSIMVFMGFCIDFLKQKGTEMDVTMKSHAVSDRKKIFLLK